MLKMFLIHLLDGVVIVGVVETLQWIMKWSFMSSCKKLKLNYRCMVLLLVRKNDGTLELSHRI